MAAAMGISMGIVNDLKFLPRIIYSGFIQPHKLSLPFATDSKNIIDSAPQPPKRPLSAYFLFASDIRRVWNQQNTGTNSPKLTSIEIGKRWNKLDPDAKKTFLDQSAKLYHEYVKMKEAYDAMKGPKRPATSYMLFMKDYFATVKNEHPGKKTIELGKEIAKKWSEMDERDKKPYKDAFNKSNEEYKIKKQEYLDSAGPLQIELLKTRSAKKLQMKQARDYLGTLSSKELEQVVKKVEDRKQK